MRIHSYDIEVAKKVGLNAAVIFYNIDFWCQKNAANGKNIKDGRAWTYNSMSAFETLFPEFSYDQIRRALDKLIEVGYVGVGSYNKDPRDRTRWFCVLRQTQLAELPDTTGENAAPLPDINPDNKQTDIPHTPKGDLFGGSELPSADLPSASQADLEDQLFTEFYEAYPKCKRKTGRPKAKRAFVSIVRGKHKDIPKTDAKEIISGVKGYAASNPNPEYIPMPTTWLNDQRWLIDEDSQEVDSGDWETKVR